VVLWDMSGAKPREQALPQDLAPYINAQALAFAPDGQTIAVASGTEVPLWDVANRKKPKRRSWRLPGPVMGVTFAPDGRHLITANSNGTAYALRLEAPASAEPPPKPPAPPPVVEEP
jgi:WD40 repeat protein